MTQQDLAQLDSDDRRDNFRIAVEQDQNPAVCKIGWRTVDGVLLDVSTGGCCIVVSSKAKVKLGDKISVATGQGTFKAKVRRITTDDQGRKKVGLEVVEEMPRKLNENSISFSDPRHTLEGSASSALITVVLIAGLLTYFGLIYFEFVPSPF